MGVEQQEFGEDDDELFAARGEEIKVEKTCTIAESGKLLDLS